MTATLTAIEAAPLPVPVRAPADYKTDVKPIWCPGCGDYSVLMSMAMALAELGRPPEEIVVVSGIGCSSRIPAYVNTYGFHGVHGRALPVATGIKLSRPELTVIAAGGDGDGYSIGGNHFLHSCRRNVDIAYLVMDNRVYGMTKGQPSPTTEPEWDSDLAPGGTGLRPFNPLAIALAAGANFIARAFSGDPAGTARIVAEAIRAPGFSFVEILSPCVTFRPDEREWRKLVRPAPVTETSDPGRAARRLMTDDGFNLGILYRGDRRAYQPRSAPVADAERALERAFEL
ncbi:MAG: 2-oxoacid:ferredoxin oxidoreductase subunit beta [Alphaproteobacteria bacterium]|nr:2-oxoacid:ferredoxin oxidoreductase subunit beta [Alphaproteobacteria bacterium]